MTADRDDLAAILAKHPATLERNRADDHLWQCLCGQIMGLSDSPLESRHRAHVAQMVLESHWLAAVKAQAWDEGRDVGHEDTYLNLIEGRGDFDAAETPNPYRTTEDAMSDADELREARADLAAANTRITELERDVEQAHRVSTRGRHRMTTCTQCGHKHNCRDLVPPEPPIGTWVKDRYGAVSYRQESGGWGEPGTMPFGRWEAMWLHRGPLIQCGRWGIPTTGPDDRSDGQ